MGTRSIRKTETRQRILEKARSVLAQKGLFAARTQDIAAAAGVAHGTVFVHFPTREALIAAVVEEFGARMTERVHELVEAGMETRRILEAHVAGLAEFEAFYARLVGEGGSIPESVQTSLLMIQSALAFHLGQAVARETKQGSLRPMRLPLLFNTWLGLVHHYILNKHLFAPDDATVLGRWGRTLVAHFMLMIREKPPAKIPAKGR
jgi:AcrR family transcriptional regulator